MMRLLQIPISHNCVKVRRALELKHLKFEVTNIAPMDRSAVQRASGQGLVPVLEDGGKAISDSTAILAYLEQRYPEPALVPREPAARAECWLLEDWADAALMERTRRIAYWQVLRSPDGPAGVFEPAARGLRRWLLNRAASRALRRRFGLSAARNVRDEGEARRLARLAVERLGGRPFLVGDAVTVADVTLAAMAAPLAAADPAVASDPAIRALLVWGETILGPELAGQYRRPAAS